MTSTKKTTTVREALRTKAGLLIEPLPPVTMDQSALDEGRKAQTHQRKEGAAVPSIESKFKFAPLDSDADFPRFHVEALLDEAAALLDRCDTERTRRDALQLEKWKLQVELDQMLRVEKVDDRERQAGRDTLAYERAVFDSAAQKGAEEFNRDSEGQLKQLIDELLASGFNKRMAARELSGWLASYPLKDHDLSGDDASYIFDGAKKTKPDHLYDAARLEADEEAWEQVYTLMSQRFAAMAASEAGRLRKQSLERQAAWSKADIGFRSDRAQAAKDAAWEKAAQIQSPGGLLNYNDRITASERRFAMDFRESLARLQAARSGLKDLFDYAPAFPEEGSAGYFDQVALWTRNAINRTGQIRQGAFSNRRMILKSRSVSNAR